jgi:ketosteroid isomerase-like protein
MSQENVQIVRRFTETYARGDHAGALACLAPEVDYHVGQESPARDPEAVRAVWERWESDWDDLETVGEEYLDAGGDKVVATIRYSGRGRGSGIELLDRRFEVHTLRDGQIVRKVDFRDRSEALRVAGLSESA